MSRLLTISLLILAAAHAFALTPAPTDPAAAISLNGDWKFMLLGSSYGPLKASSEQTDHFVPMGMDGDEKTRWCASGDALPQWYQVDLGAVRDLDRMEIMWEHENGGYRVKVEGSDDGKQMRTLVDLTGEAQSQQRQTILLTGKKARFVRLNVIGANPGSWVSFYELKMFVSQDGQPVQWQPTKGGDEGANFYQPSLNDATWDTIPVPSNWEILGYSYPTYWGPDNTEGLYRKWVNIPATWAGKRIVIQFDGVQNGARVYCNGHEVGYHESGYTGWEMDLTPYLKPGEKNLLAVRVTKNTPSCDLDTGDYQFLGGIYRDSKLIAVPELHLVSTKIETTLSADNSEATVTAKVVVAGKAGEGFSLAGQATPRKSAGGTMAFRTDGTVGPDGTAEVTLTEKMIRPNLWSAEKPNLYDLNWTLKAPGTEEKTAARIGIREVTIRDGVVYLNGAVIKCTGTCRHEIWPDRGAALTEANWRRDIELWKGANINAIRTSHYNPASRLLELCDELGIYVLEEVPFCWAPVDNLKLQPAFIQRATETLHRDWNHPCVIAWSLGNENSDGPNCQAVVDSVKANDTTRPRFISCREADRYPGCSFDDFHYPGRDGIRGIAASDRRKRFPATITEEPHIFYVEQALKYDYGCKDLWGENLNRVWTEIWKSDSILGAFIWEWQDQVTADKYPDRKTDIDPETGLRGVAKKGVVDGWRNPKPEYWHVKNVYSPVRVWGAQFPSDIADTVQLDLENRYSFTNLNELTVRATVISADGKQLRTVDAKVTLAPRTRAMVTLQGRGLKPVEAGSTLRLDFIHPVVGAVFSYAIRSPASPPPPPMRRWVPWTCVADGDVLRIKQGDVSAIYDLKLGLWRQIAYKGRPLVVGGPLPNLGGERKTNGEHGAKDFVQSDPVLTSSKSDWTADDVGRISIHTVSDYSVSDVRDAKLHVVYYWTIPDKRFDMGGMNVNYEMTWQGLGRNAWEVGMVLPCPQLTASKGAELSWDREALWTVYPPDHIGADHGTAKAGTLSFRSSKWNTTWAELVDATGTGIALGNRVHIRGGEFGGVACLFLSERISPPYDFSTWTLSDYLIRLDDKFKLEGGFGLGCVGK